MYYEPFTVERLGDILRLGLSMQEEGDYNVVPFDVETAAVSTVNMVIDNPNGFGVLAYTDEGKAVGMMAGFVSPYYFSKGRVANDLVWYVLPEYRGSRASIKMISMFTDWAKEQGATALYIGVSTGITTDRTGKFLEKRGFDHVGGNYRVLLNG